MNKNFLIFLIIGFLLGIVAGYATGITVFQSQISILQKNLTNAENTIINYEDQISNLESQVTNLQSRITPESGFEAIIMYGFSFKYPEYMQISISNPLSETGANKNSGILTAQNPDITETITLMWTDISYPRDLDNALDGDIALTPNVTSTGERITSTVNGHEIKYQSYTISIEDTTYNIVISYWNCDSTQKVFRLGYFTTEEAPITRLLKVLDSFKCH